MQTNFKSLLRRVVRRGLCASLALICLDVGATADARGFARGGGRGGGYAARARTSIYRGAYGGVAARRVTARSGYGYGRVSTLPVYNRGVYSVAGVARRTARRTTRGYAYANGVASNYGYNYGYYYGASGSYLPAGCTSILYQGQSAYNCNGVIYIVDWSSGSAVYYPVQ